MVGREVEGHGTGAHEMKGYEGAGHGMAGHGMAVHRMEGHGMAGHGMAGHGMEGLVLEGGACQEPETLQSPLDPLHIPYLGGVVWGSLQVDLVKYVFGVGQGGEAVSGEQDFDVSGMDLDDADPTLQTSAAPLSPRNHNNRKSREAADADHADSRTAEFPRLCLPGGKAGAAGWSWAMMGVSAVVLGG